MYGAFESMTAAAACGTVEAPYTRCGRRYPCGAVMMTECGEDGMWCDEKIRVERRDGGDMNNVLPAGDRTSLPLPLCGCGSQPIVYQAKTHCVRGKDTQCAEQHNRNESLNPSRFVMSYICDAI